MNHGSGDKARIFHILDGIYEIISYVAHATQEDFLNNSMMRSATVKQLEIIGMSARKISNELREAHPEIPWKLMSTFSDSLVHEYFGVNYEIVWMAATRDIITLRSRFEKIAKKLNEEELRQGDPT